MRVLHVGAGNLYGGIEAVLVATAAHRGASPAVEHEFALFFEGRVARELRATGAALHILKEVSVRRPWTVLRARYLLTRLVRERGVDVVLAHGTWPYAVVAPVARRNRLLLALYVHGGLNGKHWIDRWAAFTSPDTLLANSSFTLELGESAFPDARSRHIVRYPVTEGTLAARQSSDLTCRATIRDWLATPPEDVVIAIAARMEEWKGHAVLLRALSHLRELAGWRCWIIGGPQRPEEERTQERLKELATACGIVSRIRWLGQQDNVPGLLRAADLYCQPNTGPEPFGVVFVEALYAGLPIVTSAAGGAIDIVDESCGILVPLGDVQAVAAAITRLVVDPSLRTTLSSAGPTRARLLCDPERQVAELAAVFLDEGRGRSSESFPRKIKPA